MINKINILLILFLIMGLGACTDSSDTDFPSAPLGDKNALEKLADAYRKESERLPSSLSFITPKAKKIFIQNVFSRAGFSYHKTLSAISNSDGNNTTKLHKDLAELLAVPHQGLNHEQRSEIYSDSEIALVNKLDKQL